ncbi:MAG: acyltransferase [Desulfobacteraceae bacterium]|nr:MAG: acyltransferase [Desulfobacteraceae bacterium]
MKKMFIDFEKIKRGLRNPRSSYIACRALLKGFYYKFKYRILFKKIKIGKNFRVIGKLSIRGPGKVTIGDNALIVQTLNPVTPWSYHKDAEILIGHNVHLNGTRLGCAKRIEIGDNSIMADCRILDTDFHSIIPEKRNDPAAVKTHPIKIGKNVWIAMNCIILRGVTIGDHSTIVAGSVVTKDIPEYSVYGGNPAVFIKEAPRNTE